jgi:tRNA threonylcarbamoyladenosine biosynthesis protein TsaB
MCEINLAIETAAHQGWITLGRGDEILETAALERKRRHNIELMPTLDALLARHHIQRTDLKEIYVSLGPGSFTGLRIALATVKMLAMVLSARVVGVPSLEVVAQNAPAAAQYVAVGLHNKRGTVHSQVFGQSSDTPGRWVALGEARLRTMEQLLDEAPRPVTLLGEAWPELPEASQEDETITILPAEWASPRSDALWHLGRQRAGADQYDDPATLEPLYIREPEAVTLWRQREKA